MEELKKEIAELRELVQQCAKEVKNEVRGLIEIQQRIIHQTMGVPVPPKPQPLTEYGTKYGIEITKLGDDRVKISGKKTFEIREVIKSAGNGNAKFDQDTKTWSIPLHCLGNLVDKLTEQKKEFMNRVEIPSNDNNNSNDDDCMF